MTNARDQAGATAAALILALSALALLGIKAYSDIRRPGLDARPNAFAQVRKFWQDWDNSLKIVVRTSLWMGVVCLVFGIFGELSGLWGELAYITNIFSGLTAAFFGLPFTAVVIGALATSFAETNEHRRALRLRDAALDDFVVALAGLTQLNQATVLRRNLQLLKDRLDYLAAPTPGFPGYYSMQASELRHHCEEVRSVIPSNSRLATFYWVNVQAKWKFLNDFAKPKMLENGEPWIADEKIGDMQGVLTIEHLFSRFYILLRKVGAIAAGLENLSRSSREETSGWETVGGQRLDDLEDDFALCEALVQHLEVLFCTAYELSNDLNLPGRLMLMPEGESVDRDLPYFGGRTAQLF